MLALQAIALQVCTIGKQLDKIASMRAGMIASLQTCVPIANLLYMCKAKKLLPGGNAFFLIFSYLASHFARFAFFACFANILSQLATTLHVVQVASLHENILLVCFPPSAVERHLVACMQVSMRDSS